MKLHPFFRVVTLLLIVVVAAYFYFNKSTTQKEPVDLVTLGVNGNINSIAALHEKLLANQISCYQVINFYLDRVLAFDLEQGFNSYLELNAAALTQAKVLDAYLVQNKMFKGPLHCVPIAIKDNIDVATLETTNGSLTMLGTRPLQDAQLVENLRDAGAIILGKTSMDGFAEGFTGVSNRALRTGNAYQPRFLSGGSSGGTAVAVSANFAMAGVGTDNCGSVRIPAAFNGLFGLRPSYDLVSTAGIFPRGYLDGAAGPIATNPMDLAIMLESLRGQDYYNTYQSQIVPDALKGKRIGLLTQYGDTQPFVDISPELEKALATTKAAITAAGGTVVENVQLPDVITSRDYNLAGEIVAMNDYLQRTSGPHTSVESICLSGHSNLMGGGEDCLKHIDANFAPDSPEFKAVVDARAKNRAYITKVMQQQNLDALLYPIDHIGYAKKTPPTELHCVVSSNSALPALAFPVDMTAAPTPMPVAMQLLGYYEEEGALIALVAELMEYLPNVSPPAIAMEPLATPQKVTAGNILTHNQQQLSDAFAVTTTKNRESDELS